MKTKLNFNESQTRIEASLALYNLPSLKLKKEDSMKLVDQVVALARQNYRRGFEHCETKLMNEGAEIARSLGL